MQTKILYFLIKILKKIFLIFRQNSSGGSQIALNPSSKLLFPHIYSSNLAQVSSQVPSSLSVLYGVGMNYQLLELQQIYRHPKKIYEIALNLATQQQTTNLASNQNNAFNNNNKQQSLYNNKGSSSLKSSIPNVVSQFLLLLY